MNTNPHQAVLSLGANLGDAAANLARAVQALTHLPHTHVLRTSQIHRTTAVEVPSPQPDYLNLCVLLETTLPPHALLGSCLGIEAALGRERPYPHAPRIIDIDLICMQHTPPIDDAILTLPHPRAAAREFVTIPMAELDLTW